ncbi:uncharacterized protein LOC133843279 [Drosophila sulfurigaster albostrigata]|uniref:uncharacterized protein LOC133843279 n=1 Tax=Drosophila sulfurigaster albostrigata TaxID=89887 RepID=UPI002D21A4B2|nr:uncharacterized protein LOC133843279 [Drosophila sulfurigaster albostrigata]
MVSSTNLINLNAVCIIEILKQIQKNCEINENTNYTDLINFALTCEWFRDVFLEWNPSLYEKLKIEQKYLVQSKSIVLNFDKLYKRLEKLTETEKTEFWNIYVKCIKFYKRLEKIEFRYNSNEYDKYHGEIINLFMDAITFKGRLKILILNMEGWYLQKLPQLRQLKQLSVNVKIDGKYLVDYCKLNSNLTRLDLMKKEHTEQLVEIIKHCKKLRDLTFVIKKDLVDAEYIELMELSDLVNLRILGVHESGSLTSLFKALAAKKSSHLARLVIDTAPLDIVEIAKACEIKSLEEFRCRFANLPNFYLIIYRVKGNDYVNFTFECETDATDLAFLADLPKFQSLRIYGRHKPGTLKPLFKRIAAKENPHFQRLKILQHNGIRTMFNNDEMQELLRISTLDNLNCVFADELPMDFPTQLPDLYIVTIESHESSALRCLFQAFGNELYFNLQSLTIAGFPMELEDLLQIAKIQSITDLNCGLSDLNSICELTRLSQLKLLTINSSHELNDFSEAIVNFIKASKGNVSLLSNKNGIGFDRNVRALTITMSEKMNSAGLTPLARVPNLPNIIIYGENQHNCLTGLFREFANHEATVLQELSFNYENLPNSLDEVTQIAKIKTLRYLECGFSEPLSLELLQHLPQLEALRVTSTHQLKDIANEVLAILMGCANEITISRSFRDITYNKDQRRLTITNSSYDNEVLDAQEYAALSQLPQMKSLHIVGRHKLGTFKDLFAELAMNANSTLQEIIFRNKDKYQNDTQKLLINNEETEEIVKISSIKRLKCGFSDAKSIKLLTKLINLKELNITRYLDGSLELFLQEWSSVHSPKLQSLNLSGKSLKYEEIAQVAKINSIKRLDCAVGDGQNVELLAQLKQLEELNIRADEVSSLARLFQALVITESKTLQHLKIANRALVYEEMQLISQMQNLKKLSCTLNCTESIKILSNLTHLNEISIEFDQCEVEDIEMLAQLKNLVCLDIKSPEVGSLRNILPQLINLQSLTISGNDINSSEFSALVNLTNLEVLEITSYFYIDDNYTFLLSLMQNCRQLKSIVLHYASRFVGLDFMKNALRILKEVRNPQEQEALRLQIPYFGGLTPEQIAISEPNLIIICRFAEELD